MHTLLVMLVGLVIFAGFIIFYERKRVRYGTEIGVGLIVLCALVMAGLPNAV